MHRFSRIAIGAIAVVALSACGGGNSGTGGAPTGAASQPAGAAPCEPSTATGTVAAAMKDFAFDPTSITAKVGDVITWTNNGAVGHTATVDDQPTCDTKTVGAGKTGSLVFNVAGTYNFHCSIHSSMKGTITITG
jgi:plastocyanin